MFELGLSFATGYLFGVGPWDGIMISGAGLARHYSLIPYLGYPGILQVDIHDRQSNFHPVPITTKSRLRQISQR